MEKNVDVDGIQVLAELVDGKEVGDPTPVAPPVGLTRELTMADRIQQMVRREVSQRAEALGMETLDEANDFDMPDDPLDPSTPYEEQFDPVEAAAARALQTQELKDKVEKRHKEMRARKYPDEVQDGSSSDDKGRDATRDSGSGKSGEVVQDKPKPKSRVQGSGSKTNRDDTEPEE